MTGALPARPYTSLTRERDTTPRIARSSWTACTSGARPRPLHRDHAHPRPPLPPPSRGPHPRHRRPPELPHDTGRPHTMLWGLEDHREDPRDVRIHIQGGAGRELEAEPHDNGGGRALYYLRYGDNAPENPSRQVRDTRLSRGGSRL